MTNFRCAYTALLGAVALIYALPATGLANTGTPLANCGTISSPGLYDLNGDLVNLGGGCIEVTSPGVILNLKGHSIGGGQQGIGIKVASTATNFILAGGGATINHFAVGLEVDAPGAWIGNFTVTSCTSGVLLNGANNSIIYHYTSSNNFGDGTDVVSTTGAELLYGTTNSNQPNGVRFIGSSHNVLDFFISRSNSDSNVVLSPLPPPPKVKGKGTPSTFNVIVDGGLENANLSLLIEKTSTSNIISEVQQNPTRPALSLDFFDRNPGCGKDQWFANGFKTFKPGCVKNPK